jgi:hypothetical protein
LQELFAAALAVLRGRVDALEVRTATLKKQPFSTTTHLNGEVVINGAAAIDDFTARIHPFLNGDGGFGDSQFSPQIILNGYCYHSRHCLLT